MTTASQQGNLDREITWLILTLFLFIEYSFVILLAYRDTIVFCLSAWETQFPTTDA